MEMNVEKPKVMKISMKPYQVHITMDKKQMENVEYFNYLDSVITTNESCTRHTKSKTAIAKAALNKKNKTNKLRGLSPHANYTDRAAAAGRRS